MTRPRTIKGTSNTGRGFTIRGRRIMAIDPAFRHAGRTSGTAYAVADVEGAAVIKDTIRTGRLRFTCGDPAEYVVNTIETARIRGLASAVSALSAEQRPAILAVELPGYYTRRGEAAAGTGKIRKLSMAVGAIMAAAHVAGVEVVAVPVATWFQGRTDRQVIYEVKTVFGRHLRDGVTTDEIMAVGLLDWYATAQAMDQIVRQRGG